MLGNPTWRGDQDLGRPRGKAGGALPSTSSVGLDISKGAESEPLVVDDVCEVYLIGQYKGKDNTERDGRRKCGGAVRGYDLRFFRLIPAKISFRCEFCGEICDFGKDLVSFAFVGDRGLRKKVLGFCDLGTRMMKSRGVIHPTAEEVISKLMDEGDFDTLRLKIIRKLKDNEDLRNRIVSEVKQSVTLNRDGAENLKPRQLSDGIHQEIGNKIMEQISNELWRIIKSDDDGMQNEIKDTIESVYNKMINPPRKEEHISTPSDQPSDMREYRSLPNAGSTCDGDTDLPPGFAVSDQVHSVNCEKGEIQEQWHDTRSIDVKVEPNSQHDMNRSNHVGTHPGYPHRVEVARNIDMDLDVPPGFG